MPAGRLLDATHGTVITDEGHGYDAERGELWFAGETAEAVLLEMDARRRALADEADELAARATSAARAAEEAAAAGCRGGGGVRGRRASALPDRRSGRRSAGSSRLRSASSRPSAGPQRPPCAWRSRSLPVSRSGREQAGELGGELRRLSALESDAAREAADAVARAQAAEVVVARLGGTVEGIGADGAATA